MRIAFLGILFSLLFASCEYSTEWKTVEKDGFALDVPPYVGPLEDIASNAVLEYGSMYRNFYIVVKKLPRANTKLVAAQKTKELLDNENFNQSKIETERAYMLNEMYCQNVVLSGNVGKTSIEERITYNLNFIDTRNEIYELVIWNWTKNYEKNKEDIERIIASFKLNNN